MSPDRVIVGEIRGPEVIPMCNAMSLPMPGELLFGVASALASLVVVTAWPAVIVWIRLRGRYAAA